MGRKQKNINQWQIKFVEGIIKLTLVEWAIWVEIRQSITELKNVFHKKKKFHLIQLSRSSFFFFKFPFNVKKIKQNEMYLCLCTRLCAEM